METTQSPSRVTFHSPRVNNPSFYKEIGRGFSEVGFRYKIGKSEKLVWVRAVPVSRACKKFMQFEIEPSAQKDSYSSVTRKQIATMGFIRLDYLSSSEKLDSELIEKLCILQFGKSTPPEGEYKELLKKYQEYLECSKRLELEHPMFLE